MATTLITRQVLAERVLRILEKEGQSKEATYDIREVKREIDNVANSILKLEWFGNKKEGDKALRSHYLAEFTGVTIVDNSGNNYAVIPVPYISLPMGMGIFRVAPEQGADTGKAMIPLNPYDMDLLSGLPAGTFERQWSYELRRDRIYFGTNNSQDLITAGVTTVSMTIVIIDPSEVADTAQYPLMPEQVSELIMKTVKFFAPSTQMYMDEPVQDDKF